MCINICHFFFRIINLNGGKAPLTYHLFQKLLECIEPPESAVPTIDKDFLGDAVTPVKYDHDEKFGVPTLEELGKYSYTYMIYKHLLLITLHNIAMGT